jgi:hypothetical protein
MSIFIHARISPSFTNACSTIGIRSVLLWITKQVKKIPIIYFLSTYILMWEHVSYLQQLYYCRVVINRLSHDRFAKPLAIKFTVRSARNWTRVRAERLEEVTSVSTSFSMEPMLGKMMWYQNWRWNWHIRDSRRRLTKLYRLHHVWKEMRD